MIRNTKQDWTPGSVVKVGFLQLVVKSAIPTPGDFKPDQYLLTNKAGDKLYAFTPHFGLQSITLDEARAMLADAKAVADHAAASAVASASRCRTAATGIDQLFAEVA